MGFIAHMIFKQEFNMIGALVLEDNAFYVQNVFSNKSVPSVTPPKNDPQPPAQNPNPPPISTKTTRIVFPPSYNLSSKPRIVFATL